MEFVECWRPFFTVSVWTTGIILSAVTAPIFHTRSLLLFAFTFILLLLCLGCVYCFMYIPIFHWSFWSLALALTYCYPVFECYILIQPILIWHHIWQKRTHFALRSCYKLLFESSVLRWMTWIKVRNRLLIRSQRAEQCVFHNNYLFCSLLFCTPTIAFRGMPFVYGLCARVLVKKTGMTQGIKFNFDTSFYHGVLQVLPQAFNMKWIG